MSNVVPRPISPDSSTYRTVADFDLVRKLITDHSLYKIPPGVRELIIEQAGEVLETGTDAQKLSAAKLLMEADKINLGLVKIAMPHKVEQITVRDMSDEELEDALNEYVRNRDSRRALTESCSPST